MRASEMVVEAPHATGALIESNRFEQVIAARPTTGARPCQSISGPKSITFAGLVDSCEAMTIVVGRM